MNKKRKMMVGVAVAVIVCLSVVSVWKMGIFEIEKNYPLYWDIYMDIEKSDEGWIIHVTDIVKSNSVHNVTLFPQEVQYRLHGNYTTENYTYISADIDPWHPLYISNPGYIYSLCPNWTPENISIKDIKGQPSPLYNITWNDNDYNDLLSVGDTFSISSTGGKIGKAEAGYIFALIVVGVSSRVVLN